MSLPLVYRTMARSLKPRMSLRSTSKPRNEVSIKFLEKDLLFVMFLSSVLVFGT